MLDRFDVELRIFLVHYVIIPGGLDILGVDIGLELPVEDVDDVRDRLDRQPAVRLDLRADLVMIAPALLALGVEVLLHPVHLLAHALGLLLAALALLTASRPAFEVPDAMANPNDEQPDRGEAAQDKLTGH